MEKSKSREGRQSILKKQVMVSIGVFILFLAIMGFLMIYQPSKQAQDQTVPINVLNEKTGQVDKEILLKNPRYANGDLDAIFDDKTEPEVLDFQLKSHPNVNHIKQVGAGNRVVMWYDVNSVYQLENALQDPEFTNMKTGELVEREWRYVVWGNESYESPVYSCSTETSVNGTQFEDCTQTGTENKTREVWKPYNSRDVPKGNIRIGIEVEVREKDYIDGVWNVGGKKISRHAEWEASLETDIVFWYKLNESSGGTAVDAVGTSNGTYGGTLPDAVTSVSDITENAQNFTRSSSDRVDTNLDYEVIDSFSVHAWVKKTSTNRQFVVTRDMSGATGHIWFGEQTSNWNGFAIAFYDGTWRFANTSALSIGDWHHAVGTYDGTTLRLWIDGNNVANTSISSSIAGSTTDWFIGSRSGGTTDNFDGVIDEVALWNRSLTSSEITTLYNEGYGCTYQACNETAVLTVTLLEPEDNANLTSNSVDFDINVSIGDSSLGVENVTIEVDYSNGTSAFTETNSSGFEGNYTFSDTLADGDYDWTAFAYGNDSVRYNASETRSFSIDTASPVINVTFPNETITFHEINTNLFLNWTATDDNLDTCIFEWNGANTTLTCNDNSTSFNITDGTVKNLTFYANDTFGNTASQTVTWDYRLFLNTETYEVEIFEGVENTFSANFFTNGSDITQANLTYDGTNRVATINDHTGNNFTVSETFNAPGVTSDENKTFFWNITQANVFFTTTPERNQTVLDISLDNCDTNNQSLLNFTLYDEESTDKLDTSQNGTIETTLQLFPTTSLTNAITNYSQKDINTNNQTICVNSNFTTGVLFLSSETRYFADAYANELHHLQNITINSSNLAQNISLFSLNESDSTEFVITFKDSSLTTVEDALIDITRKYVGEGLFRSVEISKTGREGETKGHFDTDNVIYTIIVSKFGENLATFSNVVIQCQNELTGECKLNLNALETGSGFANFDEKSGISYTLTLDESARDLTLDFSTLDGSSKTIQLNVTGFNNTLGSGDICSSSLTTSSGSIVCDIPSSYGNMTFYAEIFVDGELEVTETFKIQPKPREVFTPDIYVLVFILFLTLPFLFISSTIGMTFGGLMGVVLVILLNFIDGGGIIGITSGFLWLFAAGGIIIWKISQNKI